MIIVQCEVCGKDLGPQEEGWVMQVNEFKHGNHAITMHFCAEHMKKILGSVETVVKAEARKDGEA